MSLRHYSHKRGVNKGYVSETEKKREEDRKNGIVHPNIDVPKERALFRGLTGGMTLTTAKGSKATVMEGLWGQNIFISFNKDDVELLNIALSSSLADVTEQVTGGEFGTPFILGDFGFYSENKFQWQTELLKGLERKYAVGKYFLSIAEWEGVDTKISAVGHFSQAVVRRAVRGDTFAVLAVRANAFQVAKILCDRGVDPLVENDHGEDLVAVLKEQYGYMSDRLHHVLAHKDEAQKRVFAPSEMADVIEEDRYILETFENMVGFCDAMINNLERRLVLIHRDRQDKRRADMRKEKLDPFKSWNAEQLDKATRHIEECNEVKLFIQEKIDVRGKHSSVHVTMAELVAMQHALTVASAEGKEVDHEAHAEIHAKLARAKGEGKGEGKEIEDDVAPVDIYALMGIAEDQSADMRADEAKPEKAIKDEEKHSELLGVLRDVQHKDGGKEIVSYR
jgi:hypothetical protein